MRQLLSILLLFYVTDSCAQEIELQGRYGASFIGGETIEFIGRDSFYFGGFYCTYGVHGKGRCEIRNGLLYLYFEKNKTKVKQATLKPPIIIRTGNTDSISAVQITIVDNNDIPISNASVEVESSKSIRTGTMTDTAGQATVKIRGNSFPIVINTSGMGIEPGHLKLDNSSNYNIKLFHLQDESFDRELNKGEIFVYEIDELSEDLLLMRPEKSSTPFREYRKKKD